MLEKLALIEVLTRLSVNQEIESLENALKKFPDTLERKVILEEPTCDYTFEREILELEKEVVLKTLPLKNKCGQAFIIVKEGEKKFNLFCYAQVVCNNEFYSTYFYMESLSKEEF